MKLYMKCTTDQFELPLAVADSAAELAKMVGLTKGSVASMLTREISGYHRIEIDDWFPTNDGGLWRYGKDGRIEYAD